jgi:transposase-like protein
VKIRDRGTDANGGKCWLHKTANVLNKVALSVQPSMKKDLREVWLLPNHAAAEVAIDVFAEKYGAKYPKGSHA